MGWAGLGLGSCMGCCLLTLLPLPPLPPTLLGPAPCPLQVARWVPVCAWPPLPPSAAGTTSRALARWSSKAAIQAAELVMQLPAGEGQPRAWAGGSGAACSLHTHSPGRPQAAREAAGGRWRPLLVDNFTQAGAIALPGPQALLGPLVLPLHYTESPSPWKLGGRRLQCAWEIAAAGRMVGVARCHRRM